MVCGDGGGGGPGPGGDGGPRPEVAGHGHVCRLQLLPPHCVQVPFAKLQCEQLPAGAAVQALQHAFAVAGPLSCTAALGQVKVPSNQPSVPAHSSFLDAVLMAECQASGGAGGPRKPAGGASYL